jgi:hypothetical protein
MLLILTFVAGVSSAPQLNSLFGRSQCTKAISASNSSHIGSFEVATVIVNNKNCFDPLDVVTAQRCLHPKGMTINDALAMFNRMSFCDPLLKKHF